MIEQVILAVIIFALMGYHYVAMKQVKEERKELMNAIVAKNAQELRDLKLADHTELKVDQPIAPDLQPLENLSDDEHMKAILNQLRPEGEE